MITAAVLLAATPVCAEEQSNKAIIWEAAAKTVVMSHSFEDLLFDDEAISALDLHGGHAVGPELSLTAVHRDTRLFLRGIAAYQRKFGGTDVDEDFFTEEDAAIIAEDLGVPLSTVTDVVPIGSVFSATVSNLGAVNNFYFGIDAGIRLGGQRFQFSPFVGYFFFRDVYESFGAVVLPDDVGGVVNGPPGTVQIPLDELVLREQVTWRGFRVGFDFRTQLSDRWVLDLTAAGMPGTGRLRNPNDFPFSGAADGTLPTFFVSSDRAASAMIDASLGYRLTQSLTLTAGGRYWLFNSRAGETLVGPSLPLEEQVVLGGQNILRAAGGTIGLRYAF